MFYGSLPAPKLLPACTRAVLDIKLGPKPKQQGSGNLDAQLARQASTVQLGQGQQPAGAAEQLPSIAKLLQEAAHVVVVDEAHVIKSESVRRPAACVVLCLPGGSRWALLPRIHPDTAACLARHTAVCPIRLLGTQFTSHHPGQIAVLCQP